MTGNQPHIGTSGWHYDHWKGPFYPEHMASEQFLSFYARCFLTVEVNNTFYQLPDEEILAGWRETVPGDFTFAVKASRYITHMKKLSEPEGPVTAFISRVELLQDRLGPILFQLPPNWHRDVERLKAFLGALPEGHRYAFEFRDPTWFDARVYQALANHDVAFCIYTSGKGDAPQEVTSEMVYLRFHGPAAKFQGSYTDQQLSNWASTISEWIEQGKEVYCYFNNDPDGRAPANAQTLRAMLAS